MSSLNGLTASSLPDCVCLHSFDRYTIAKSQQSHALSVPGKEELQAKLAKANEENKGMVVYPEYFKKKKKRMRPDLSLIHISVEQRAQILRDSCDQIVERSYTRKFDQEESNERRADLANVAIQKADLEQSLARCV